MAIALSSHSRHLTIERYCEEMDTWETVGREPEASSSDVTGRYHLPLRLVNERYPYEYEDDES